MSDFIPLIFFVPLILFFGSLFCFDWYDKYQIKKFYNSFKVGGKYSSNIWTNVNEDPFKPTNNEEYKVEIIDIKESKTNDKWVKFRYLTKLKYAEHSDVNFTAKVSTIFSMPLKKFAKKFPVRIR